MMMNRTAIRNIITNEFKVEGALRSEVQMSIKRFWILPATVAFVIVKDYRFVDSVHVPTAVQVKVSVKQLPVRRKY